MVDIYTFRPHNKRMQPDFGKLALASAADAGRYVESIYRPGH